MTELLLLRHAEPENVAAYIGRGSHPGLSAEGRRTAEAIAGSLAAQKPTVLASSSQVRALETLEPLSRRIGVEIEEIPDLDEMDFGEWEGLTWQEVEAREPEGWRAWLNDPWHFSAPGGETLHQLRDRVIPAVEALLDAHPKDRILVATHGGPIRVVLGHALLLDPAAYWSAAIDYAALCRFHRRKHEPMEMLQWNVPMEPSTA